MPHLFAIQCGRCSNYSTFITCRVHNLGNILMLPLVVETWGKQYGFHLGRTSMSGLLSIVTLFSCHLYWYKQTTLTQLITFCWVCSASFSLNNWTWIFWQCYFFCPLICVKVKSYVSSWSFKCFFSCNLRCWRRTYGYL